MPKQRIGTTDGAEVINLRRARKRRRLEEEARAADENRVRFGRTRAERDASTAERGIAERRHAGRLLVRDRGDTGEGE